MISLKILVTSFLAIAQSATSSPAQKHQTPPPFGPNVFIYGPASSPAAIQQQIDTDFPLIADAFSLGTQAIGTLHRLSV